MFALHIWDLVLKDAKDRLSVFVSRVRVLLFHRTLIARSLKVSLRRATRQRRCEKLCQPLFIIIIVRQQLEQSECIHRKSV